MPFTRQDCKQVLEQAFPDIPLSHTLVGYPSLKYHGFQVVVSPTNADDGATMTATLRSPQTHGSTNIGAADSVEGMVAIIKRQVGHRMRIAAAALNALVEGWQATQ